MSANILSSCVVFVCTLNIWTYAEVDSSITLEIEVLNTPEQYTLLGLVNGPKQDCCSLQLAGNTKNGVYTIYPYENILDREIKVYCDLETAGGGWTLIQRREPVTGPIERFYRDWKSYSDGFGKLIYSHWLGLENIAALTAGHDQSIRFDLEDWESQKRYALYETFHVGTKEYLYQLDVTNYTGDAGDSFIPHNGKNFSTKDADNDLWQNHCAQIYKGAWWHNKCHTSNLNGLYVVNGSHLSYADGVNWKAFKGHNYSLKLTEMKIRNRNFPNGCSR